MEAEVEVSIGGQSFRLKAGEASPAYIEQLATYVDERMRAISSTSKTMPLTRTAILAALNIADDLFKARDHFDQSLRFVHTKTEHLIALVQEQLADV